MPALDLEARPEAVPRARGFARDLLDGWGEQDLRDDVDLLLTELVTNAVLHAPGEARVVVDRAGDGVRLAVLDSSPTAPVRRTTSVGAMTGRGLNLVSALSSSWGVSDRDDGRAGKAVWCLVAHDRPEQPVPDIDLEALLAAFDDGEDDEDATATVPVGQAPVAVLLEAKDHLDGLLREIALAEGSSGLPQEVVDAMAGAVRHFDAARTQLRALLTAATARGQERVDIVFRHLPTSLAEVGEEYLAALRAADDFARDRRMLSLESPVEHRVLREWYVQGLVAGLRSAREGRTPVPGESFEHRLLRELHRLEEVRRSLQLAAQLQRVGARLALTQDVDQVAATAVAEGVLSLGAAGGRLMGTSAGQLTVVAEAGVDEGMAGRYRAVTPEQRRAGPTADAVRTGRPVFVEGRQDRDGRYPHLAEVQPAVVALAALPLLVQGRVTGALRLSWTVPHVFTDEERDFLEGLAAQTGLALDRAEALRRLHDLRDEVERLLPASGRVSGVDLGVLRTLYDDAPVGIAVHDAQGRYLRVNALVASVSGRTTADHVGRSVSEQFPGRALAPARARLEALLGRVLGQGAPAEDELVLPQEVGGRSWRLSCFPVRAADGSVEAAVVLSIETTAQRAAERRALQANERLGLLDQIGAALTATLDVDEALARLAGLLVSSSLADLVSVDLREHGEVPADREVVTTSADPRLAEVLRATDEARPRRRNPASAVYQVLHGAPYVHLVVTPEHLEHVALDPEQLAAFRALDLQHALMVPLVARDRVLGVLSLLRTTGTAGPFEDADVLLALEVGRRAGLMVDNAAQYTAQRAVAEGLQRSLLPELPDVEGVDLGAAYLPSSSAAAIGGDWYDAFVLPGGAVGLVIGDVMGHDVAAAAAMGKLRSVLRSCAAEGERPADVLDRLDRLVSSFAMADLATVVYARFALEGGGAVLTWANAGHPPPLLLAPDGTATYLEDGRSIMVGAPQPAGPPEPRGQAQRLLEPGSTVVMFTDGLVERRGAHLDDQLAALAVRATDLWRELDDPGELCRRLLSALPPDPDSDDAAVVALTLRPPTRRDPR